MKKNSLPIPKNTPPGKDKKELLIRLLVNTVLLLAIYYGCIFLLHFPYILHIYATLGLVLLLVYMIYNKGMAGRQLTPEMLSDTMTAEEKNDFIQKVKLRMQRSRWMLTLLFPIAVTIAIDVFYVYVLEGLLA